MLANNACSLFSKINVPLFFGTCQQFHLTADYVIMGDGAIRGVGFSRNILIVSQTILTCVHVFVLRGNVLQKPVNECLQKDKTEYAYIM